MGDNPKSSAQELRAIQRGIKAGARVIDTAEMYGEGKSESLIGEAVQIFDREELYIISKVYPWNASKKQLPVSLEDSLKRLKTEYLDLYLLHWTGSIPLSETVDALEKAKAQGKIRQWGVSIFDVKDMEELFALPQGKNCAANEVLYNLGSRGIEFDLLPWMRANNVPLIAYSPIAQGDSLGDQFSKQPVLQQLANKYKASIFQILLAWSIRNGQTLAIPQSSKEAHVIENIQGMDIELSKFDLAQIDAVYPKPTRKQPLDVL